MSEWSLFPNAQHIDRVIASYNATPQRWHDSMKYDSVVASGAFYDAYVVATKKGREGAYKPAWEQITRSNYVRQQGTVLNAIVALIAYDNIAYMLQEKPEHVELLAVMDVLGAVLLLPASAVFNQG